MTQITINWEVLFLEEFFWKTLFEGSLGKGTQGKRLTLIGDRIMSEGGRKFKHRE